MENFAFSMMGRPGICKAKLSDGQTYHCQAAWAGAADSKTATRPMAKFRIFHPRAVAQPLASCYYTSSSKSVMRLRRNAPMTWRTLFLAGLSLPVLANPALAHHSFSMFD